MASGGIALDSPAGMPGWKRQVVPAVAGAVTFGAVQSWLLAASSGSGTADPGWFLNGRDASLAVLTAMALVSTCLSAVRQGNQALGALAFTVGAVVSLTIVLFSIGPGTIFPIVIAVGAVVLAGAAFLGAGLGWLLRWAWTGRPH